MDQLNKFDRLVENMKFSPTLFRDAIVDVCDTAYAAKVWLETYGLQPTAADVVALTKIIVDRHAVLAADAKADMRGDE